MNHDQTAWDQSDPGPFCLQYRLPKKKGRQQQQMTKVISGGNIVNAVRFHMPYIIGIYHSLLKAKTDPWFNFYSIWSFIFT